MLLICLPVTAWVTAILVTNQVPDIVADRQVNKLTLAARFGARGARYFHYFLTAAAFAASAVAVARNALPLWYLLPAVALATLGGVAGHGISADPAGRATLKKSIVMNLIIHTLGCVALLVAILWRSAS